MPQLKLPLWSAIIPTYGDVGVRLTTDALRSLQLCTESHEILVVDDGSGGEVQERLASLCDDFGARLIPLAVNGGFAKATNAGLAVANGRVLILWNNDVRAIKKTCDDLANFVMFTNYATAGIKLLYEDFTIQHAGVYYVPAEPYGWFDHILRNGPRWDNLACRIRPSLCTGAVLAINRVALDCVGLLDERYGMAFEDIDYQLRCMETRLSIYYCGIIEASHLEGKTRGASPQEKAQHNTWTEAEQRSRERFFDRWHGVDWQMFMAGA